MDDLKRVVNEQWAEDVSFEIKEALPLNNGAKGWVGAGKLHSSEREGLAKEVVAFANTRGGLLIVGISESDEAPKRAKGFAAALPNVAALAERLSQALSASIDPPLRGLEVQPISETDGSGYLLIRVSPSILAPHGFGAPAQAYIRKQDRSEPMSMRELQATFWESRTRIERIDALRKEKQEQLDLLSKHQNCFVYRLTAIPEVELPLFSLLPRILNTNLLPSASQRSGSSALAAPWPFFFEPSRWQPDLNSVRAWFRKGDLGSGNGYWEIDVSGAVSVFGEVENTYNAQARARIHAAWVQATCADLLTLALVLSRSCGSEGQTWSVDGEIFATSHTATVGYGPQGSMELSIPKLRPFRPVPVELSQETNNFRSLEEAISSALKVPAHDGALRESFHYNLKSLSLQT